MRNKGNGLLKGLVFLLTAMGLAGAVLGMESRPHKEEISPEALSPLVLTQEMGTVNLGAPATPEAVAEPPIYAEPAWTVDVSPAALTVGQARQVVFTVKRGGQAEPGLEFSFKGDPRFPGLRTGPRLTDGRGQIILKGLRATEAGVIPLNLVIDQKTALVAVMFVADRPGGRRNSVPRLAGSRSAVPPLAVQPLAVQRPATAAPALSPRPASPPPARTASSGPALPAPVAPTEAGALNKALSVLGLPSMAGASSEAASPRPGVADGADASGRPASQVYDGDRLLRQAAAAGSGWASGVINGWLNNYGQARTSLNFDFNGRLSGSFDYLRPLYDGDDTTFFVQAGLRTLPGDRAVSNLGFGQRFFWGDELALGYNLFWDQDLTRGHSRGGLGGEIWYEWLRFAANYYTPLSGWKDSRDYGQQPIEERPARGWDARLTGYLPDYPNLAVTGSFEKWFGGQVGSWALNDTAHKDPHTWSYGLAWTPVPLVTASLTQRHTSGQKPETAIGMMFNLNFDMPWEDQLVGSTVADMRTIQASRHDFVNRDYSMPLEYREKHIVKIRFVEKRHPNIFVFQATDGFGRPLAGQVVTLTPRTPNFQIVDSATEQPISSAVSDTGGYFSFKVLGAGNGKVGLDAGDGGGFEFELNVDGYELSADVSLLDFQTPTPVTFTLAIGGSPAPQGLQVHLRAGQAGQANLSTGLYTVGPNGQIFIADLTALRMIDLLSITAEVDSAPSNPVSFRVGFSGSGLNPGLLTLEASLTSLEYLFDTAVDFTVKYEGVALPADTPLEFISPAGCFVNLPSQTQTEPGGLVRAPYLNLQRLEQGVCSVKVRLASGLESNGVVFNPAFDGDGGSGSGAGRFTLATNRDSLEYNKPMGTIFTARYQGVLLPANTPLTLVYDLGDLDFGSVPATTVVGPGGQAVVPNLKALKSSGNAYVKATVNGRDTNLVGFILTTFGGGQGGVYTLEANPISLEFLTATEVTFTVKYEGLPVPAGSVILLTGQDYDFLNLPRGALTANAAGQVKIPDLMARRLTGPLHINATVNGRTTNSVDFSAHTLPGGFVLSVMPTSLEYNVPVSLLWTLLYNGTPAPGGLSVALSQTAGDFSGLPNQVTTNLYGQFQTLVTPLRDPGPLQVRAAVDGRTTAPANLDVYTKGVRVVQVPISGAGSAYLTAPINAKYVLVQGGVNSGVQYLDTNIYVYLTVGGSNYTYYQGGGKTGDSGHGWMSTRYVAFSQAVPVSLAAGDQLYIVVSSNVGLQASSITVTYFAD